MPVPGNHPFLKTVPLQSGCGKRQKLQKNFSADKKSDDTDVELSRQERIELEKIIESEYEIKSLLYVGIGTIIFAFFMECFLSHEVASSGLLWLLSFFAIVTAITQSTGVYNKVFKGIILVLIGVKILVEHLIGG